MLLYFLSNSYWCLQDSIHFKRWQEKINDALDALNLAEFLIEKTPNENTEYLEDELDKWKKQTKLFGW